jgi:hypothetical protein
MSGQLPTAPVHCPANVDDVGDARVTTAAAQAHHRRQRQRGGRRSVQEVVILGRFGRFGRFGRVEDRGGALVAFLVRLDAGGWFPEGQLHRPARARRGYGRRRPADSGRTAEIEHAPLRDRTAVVELAGRPMYQRMCA